MRSSPNVKLILTRPVGEEQRWMRTPDTDDKRLLLKVLERGLAGLAAESDLSPHESAALRRLNEELTEMLAAPADRASCFARRHARLHAAACK